MIAMLNKLRLLTPGPTPLPEVVRLALAEDMIHHRKSRFKEIMAEVQERLRLLFGSLEPVLPLSCSGTGAMTAAVYSLFRPGDKVLVVEAGKFGQRWTEIARSRGLRALPLVVPWGSAVDPGKIGELLREDGEIKGILMQLSETSTGVLHPVRDVASITRESRTLLVVDGISAVGISPCPMDDWGVDCLLTGSQKGLMLPPGLALLALSSRAWEYVQPACFYFDLLAERENVAKGQTHFTSPINLIIGLRASMDLLLVNGLDAVYRKQWALTAMTRSGASSLGLELLAPEHYAWGVTAIKMPDGIDGGDVLKRLESQYGIVMAGGQDELKGKIVRMGHMGWVDWGDCLAGLSALSQCLQHCGWQPGSRSFLQDAVVAYDKAMEQGWN